MTAKRECVSMTKGLAMEGTEWFKIRLSSGMYADYVNGVLYADSKENAKSFDMAHALQIERELRVLGIEFEREMCRESEEV